MSKTMKSSVMIVSPLCRRILRASILILSYMLVSAHVYAYIGPGAGLSAIGSLFALVSAVCITILGFVWYPVKRLLRRKKPPVAAQTGPVTDEKDKQSAAE